MHTPPQVNRETILVSIAFLLSALFGLDYLYTFHKSTENGFHATQEQVKRLRLMMEQPQNWSDHLQESIEQTLSLEERFMTTTSHDLAQAEIQSWLQKLLEKYAVRRPDIRVSTAPEQQHSSGDFYRYWQVDAAISGRSKQAVTLELLNALESNPQWNLEITGVAIEKGRFLINLSVIALEMPA